MNDGLSDRLLHHCLNPHNAGPNPNADGVARRANECGEELEIWLAVSEERVVKAGFWAHACPSVIAAASVAVMQAEGRNLAEIKDIKEAEIATQAGLPDAEAHAAEFAREVLLDAVRDFLLRRREETWRKLYRV